MRRRHRGRGTDLYEDSEEVKPLVEYSAKEKVEIVEIIGGKSIKSRFMSLGFNPGGEVEILQNSHGPIVVSVKGAKLAMGRGWGRKILAKKKSLEEEVE